MAGLINDNTQEPDHYNTQDADRYKGIWGTNSPLKSFFFVYLLYQLKFVLVEIISLYGHLRLPCTTNVYLR